MKLRLAFWKAAPDAYQAMSALDDYLHSSGLDESLLHIVKLRASQMNGCAYCTDMHWKDARAALEWTEALTDVTNGHVSDAVYDAVRGQFSDKELADLAWAVAAINAWNRVAIAFRSEAGRYRSRTHG